MTAQGMKDKSLEDVFYEQDVRAMEAAFEGQMHYGTFLFLHTLGIIQSCMPA